MAVPQTPGYVIARIKIPIPLVRYLPVHVALKSLGGECLRQESSFLTHLIGSTVEKKK